MQDATRALLEAATIADRTIERALTAEGLSTTQFRLLETVGAEPDITPSVLAARLLQETHSVSGLLNRLEDRGIVDRRRAHQDRRVVFITLTEDGKALLQRARGKVGDAEDRILCELGFDMTNGLVSLRNSLESRLTPPMVRLRRQVAVDTHR